MTQPWGRDFPFGPAAGRAPAPPCCHAEPGSAPGICPRDPTRTRLIRQDLPPWTAPSPQAKAGGHLLPPARAACPCSPCSWLHPSPPAPRAQFSRQTDRQTDRAPGATNVPVLRGGAWGCRELGEEVKAKPRAAKGIRGSHGAGNRFPATHGACSKARVQRVSGSHRALPLSLPSFPRRSPARQRCLSGRKRLPTPNVPAPSTNNEPSSANTPGTSPSPALLGCRGRR